MTVFKLIFDWFFSSDKDLLNCKKNLIQGHTFSLPKSAQTDRLIGLRQSVRACRRIWSNDSFGQLNLEKSLPIILTLNAQSIKSNVEFIQLNNDQSEFNWIYKENLLSIGSVVGKISNTIVLLVLSSFMIPALALVSRNRINRALYIEYLIGVKNMVNVTGRNKSNEVYQFFCHEPDANLLAFYLLGNKNKVIKVPNANPLNMFNKLLIGSKLVFTLDYQIEEYTKNGNLPFVKWELPLFKKLKNNFSGEVIFTSDRQVIYYSHASWLRIEEDHNIPFFNEVQLEMDLLEVFKVNKVSFEVKICLHPKEKILSREKLIKFYSNYFESFSFIDGSSYDTFEDHTFGFGAFSSILFERIECGYKTLFVLDTIPTVFPVHKSEYTKFVMGISDFNWDTIKKYQELSTNAYFSNLNSFN